MALGWYELRMTDCLTFGHIGIKSLLLNLGLLIVYISINYLKRNNRIISVNHGFRGNVIFPSRIPRNS